MATRSRYECLECCGRKVIDCECCGGEIDCDACDGTGLDADKIDVAAFKKAADALGSLGSTWDLVEGDTRVGLTGERGGIRYADFALTEGTLRQAPAAQGECN